MAETSSASIEQTYSVILITYNIKYNLLVYPSVRLYPINVKTAEPIRAKILCGTSHETREGLWNMDAQNYKLCIQHFDFRKNFGNPAKKSTKILLLIYAEILSNNYKLK